MYFNLWGSLANVSNLILWPLYLDLPDASASISGISHVCCWPIIYVSTIVRPKQEYTLCFKAQAHQGKEIYYMMDIRRAAITEALIITEHHWLKCSDRSAISRVRMGATDEGVQESPAIF